MSFKDFFKSNNNSEDLVDNYILPTQHKENTVSYSTIKFSVGPDPDGDGAVIVFTQSNGINTTVTMSPASVRLLIDLLEVVVPDDPQD